MHTGDWCCGLIPTALLTHTTHHRIVRVGRISGSALHPALTFTCNSDKEMSEGSKGANVKIFYLQQSPKIKNTENSEGRRRLTKEARVRYIRNCATSL